ncbi:hypothetical protein LGA37_003703, partial [Citrobacter freundii]
FNKANKFIRQVISTRTFQDKKLYIMFTTFRLFRLSLAKPSLIEVSFGIGRSQNTDTFRLTHHNKLGT